MKQKFIITLACAGLLLSIIAATQAGPVDLNGNTLPDSSDGKAVKLDKVTIKLEPTQLTDADCQKVSEMIAAAHDDR